MRLKRFKTLIIALVSVSTFVYCQTGITSSEAINRLKDGNKRYVENKRIYPNQDTGRLNETSQKGQFPYATIIGCSDSRVPIEHVFDAGIGDIFVIRVAGNVVNTDEAGSIEYGVEHLGTPVLVVLGHSHCGAVTAVVKDVHVHGNIAPLLENIQKPVEEARKEHGTDFSDALLVASIKNNVYQSIEDILTKSEVTAELVHEGKLKVIGAIYNLATGKVDWTGEHPKQQELIKH